MVYADESITVQDILDDLIEGGRGDVEFHAPTINFEDTTTTDMLSTTSGDIVMVGGAGGINTGHLETGADSFGAEPGDIHLSTTDGGDISTRDLTIQGGQTKGDINVKADGELSVGTVAVGSGTPIDNDVAGGNAEATVYLGSGDDMFLNGPVTADAHTTSSGDATATIQVFAGLNGATTGAGDATINEDLKAEAHSDTGTSYALVEIDTYGEIEWGTDADATAIGDSAEVLGVRETEDDTDGVDEAHVWITEREVIPDLVGFPDEAVTHMGLPVEGNVLDNDVDSGGGDIDVDSYTQPMNGTVVVDEETGAFTYTPNEGYVGDDTFTYTATNGDETTDPVTVTINIGNDLPTPQNDVANTQMNQAVNGNVLANDTDGNSDPLSVVLDGTAPSHGTVVLNEDGTFTYTPDNGYLGDDTFTYDATDGQLDGTGNPVVVTATVTVHVTELLPTPSMSPVAPGLERREIEYSGCPALVKWVAKELGINESKLEIWMANAMASSRDIQPFNAYARLRTSAVILRDVSGAHIQALTQVINEFASSTAPPTEEQMASIADAIASNAGEDNHYGVAEEYLNALAQYISILNTDLGFSMSEAVEFATANYVNQLADRGNANVAAYVKSRLGEL
ncbi:Ig-like domain-containing protein [Planctomycetota bacterium]